jgi:L-cysteine:1D-myo-inositol 2-amino-2-deoxy-alpha-D-glucopyranoside ligase
VLNRPWYAPWEYHPGDLDHAAADLEELYAAAGRRDISDAATNTVTAALLDNLDVPRAIATGQDNGGEAARLLLRVLALA